MLTSKSSEVEDGGGVAKFFSYPTAIAGPAELIANHRPVFSDFPCGKEAPQPLCSTLCRQALTPDDSASGHESVQTLLQANGAQTDQWRPKLQRFSGVYIARRC